MTRRESYLIYFLAGVVGAIMIGLIFAPAMARPYHHDHGGGGTVNTTNTSVSSVTNIEEGVSQQDLQEATAKALACDQSFYMGTKRTQIGIQGAVYHGESAVCIGAAKVIGDDKDVMVNFSVVPDDEDDAGDWGYQGGVLFLF
jgi:hypothetical protein